VNKSLDFQIVGKLEVQPYTSKETPMIMYLNIHAGLEQVRALLRLRLRGQPLKTFQTVKA
jgi:hypothetical protein